MAADYEVLEHQLQGTAQALAETNRTLRDAQGELATLRQVDERAKGARSGGNSHETHDYERGWIAAAEYIFGTSKAVTS